MAIACCLEECPDEVAHDNYCVLFKSLVNEETRRKIMRQLSKSGFGFVKWARSYDVEVFQAMYESKNLNIMLDVLRKFRISWRELQIGKCVSRLKLIFIKLSTKRNSLIS